MADRHDTRECHQARGNTADKADPNKASDGERFCNVARRLKNRSGWLVDLIGWLDRAGGCPRLVELLADLGQLARKKSRAFGQDGWLVNE